MKKKLYGCYGPASRKLLPTVFIQRLSAKTQTAIIMHAFTKFRATEIISRRLPAASCQPIDNRHIYQVNQKFLFETGHR